MEIASRTSRKERTCENRIGYLGTNPRIIEEDNCLRVMPGGGGGGGGVMCNTKRGVVAKGILVWVSLIQITIAVKVRKNAVL